MPGWAWSTGTISASGKRGSTTAATPSSSWLQTRSSRWGPASWAWRLARQASRRAWRPWVTMITLRSGAASASPAPAWLRSGPLTVGAPRWWGRARRRGGGGVPEPGDEAVQALVDPHRRLVAESCVGPADVGQGGGHVTGLERELLDRQGPVELGGQQPGEVAQSGAGRGPEVVDLEAVGTVGGGHDPVHDVADVGVVAPAGPVAEDRERPALLEQSGEPVDGHLRTLAGSVDGEEPQAGDVDPVGVVDGVARQFAGPLGGGVRGGRAVGGVVLTERRGGGVPVDGGRGAEHHVPDPGGAGRLEEVDGAPDVDVDVGLRLGEGGAYAGVCRQVDDGRRPGTGHHGLEGVLVADVHGLQGEPGPVLEPGQVVALDRRVVGGIETVDPHHVRPPGHQCLGEMAADEAGRAGDQDLGPHVMPPSSLSGRLRCPGCGRWSG